MKPLSTSGLPARNHLTAKNVPANEVVVQDVLEGAKRTAPQADVFMSLVLGGDPKQTEVQRVLHSVDGYFDFNLEAADAEKAVRGKRVMASAKKWGAAAVTGLFAVGAVAALATLPLGIGGAIGVAALGALSTAGGVSSVKELNSEQAKFQRVEDKIPQLAERAVQRLNEEFQSNQAAPTTLLAETEF